MTRRAGRRDKAASCPCQHCITGACKLGVCRCTCTDCWDWAARRCICKNCRGRCDSAHPDERGDVHAQEPTA